MAILIREAIAMVASVLVCIIAFAIFNPFLDQVMAGYVMDALANPGTSALIVNGKSLLLTKDIILMGMKVGFWFFLFGIMARFFLFVGFKEQEQNYV